MYDRCGKVQVPLYFRYSVWMGTNTAEGYLNLIRYYPSKVGV